MEFWLGYCSPLKNFLTSRKQRMVQNGYQSFGKDGIPQGSTFAPLLFLIYINDLPESLKSNLFSDDTSLFSDFKDIKVRLFKIELSLDQQFKML